jgi:hypothetical protein
MLLLHVVIVVAACSDHVMLSRMLLLHVVITHVVAACSDHMLLHVVAACSDHACCCCM